MTCLLALADSELAAAAAPPHEIDALLPEHYLGGSGSIDGFRLLVRDGGGTSVTPSDSPAVIGTTYLVVGKLEDEAGTGGADLVTMWVFDGVGGDDLSSEAQAAATADVTLTVGDREFWDSGQSLTEVHAVLHDQRSVHEVSNATLDELRITTSFEAATGTAVATMPGVSANGRAALGLLLLAATVLVFASRRNG